MLFGFLMTFWSSPGQTFFISLFSGEIRTELELSDGQFGGIYSIATLMSAVLMVWSGSLVDKIDLRKLSLGLVIALAVGCGMISLSQGVISLILSIFILRQVGQGLMCLTSSTAMVRYLDANKGKATALSSMGYAVSEAVMPILVVALILLLGWRNSWMVTALMVVGIMVPLILILLTNHKIRHASYLQQLDQDSRADPVTASSIPRKKQWTRAEVIRDKRFYLFLPGMLSQQLMFTGFIFHQIHLVQSKGWSLSAWASLFALYAVISVATKLAVGIVVDRFGAIRMVPLVGIPMAVGLAILANTTDLFWGGLFLVLTGITVGFQSTVAPPFWAEMYGNQHLGSIKSLATAIMVFFTAASPLVLGILIDHGYSMESLAMGSAWYMLLASALAYYAVSLTRT